MDALPLERVLEQMEVLKKNGWRVDAPRVDEPSFGNFLVRALGEVLLLRVTQDRGIQSVDIASTSRPDDWFDLALALEICRNNGLDDASDGVSQQDVTKFVESLETITKMFSPPALETTLLRLRQLEQARAQRLFGFGRPTG